MGSKVRTICNAAIITMLFAAFPLGNPLQAKSEIAATPTATGFVAPPPCAATPAEPSQVQLTETYKASITIGQGASSSTVGPITVNYPKGWVADGGGEKVILISTDQTSRDALYYAKPLVAGNVAVQINADNVPSGETDPVHFWNNQPPLPSKDAASSKAIAIQIGGQTVACARLAGFGISPDNDVAAYFFIAQEHIFFVEGVTPKGESEKQRPLIEAIVASIVSSIGTGASGTAPAESGSATATPAATSADQASADLSQHYTSADQQFTFDYPTTLKLDDSGSHPALIPASGSDDYVLELFFGIKGIYSEYPGQEGCMIDEQAVNASVQDALETLLSCTAAIDFGPDDFQSLTVNGKPAIYFKPGGLLLINLGKGVPALLRQTVGPNFETPDQATFLAIAASIQMKGAPAQSAAQPTAAATGNSLPAITSVTVTAPGSEDQVIATDTIWVLFGGQPTIAKPGIKKLNSPKFVAKPYMLRYRWCAKTEEQRTAIVAPFSIKFFVDDQQIDPSQILVFDRVTQQNEYCRFYATLLSDWPKGGHVMLKIVYTLTDAVNNGTTTYAAGTYEADITMNVKG